MKYYQIIKDDAFVGVISSNNFVRRHRKRNILQHVSETEGQFASYNGVLYRASWMQPLPEESYVYENAGVEEISEELYNNLSAAIENEEVIDYNPPMSVITKVVDTTEPWTLEYARKAKIASLSTECTNTIESGITIEGSHYSLTITDQLNLLAAENAINSGEEEVIYHADGEDYRYFTAEEINDIISAARTWRVYNTTYYKALKAYINSLNQIDEILSISYGDEVPEEFKCEVLKKLEKE